jgi:hypothetical protein
MREGGTAVTTVPTQLWLETHTPEALLHANQRLLGLGYGVTPDAIERSYAEDFTVLPPVFIDEEAYVEAAVIGPLRQHLRRGGHQKRHRAPQHHRRRRAGGELHPRRRAGGRTC